jgi:hypothetical protein
MFFKKKNPVVTPPIIKTRDQWEAELKINKDILLKDVPKYRIYKLRDGTFSPQSSYAKSVESTYSWFNKEYIDFSTECTVAWYPLGRDTNLETLEEAEAWLATYIAPPEITYYNGPPLEKVVDFNG